eukprot:CAMPEP_0175034050 /NCGR_PEP_ID=MMETSP0005-20121125/22379_1 /TAXON_ID=420556 /ORGANISM="Ochromonas sp., Strain CCMP1393" /LENGTH=38 /DNA_ID= /DNA_START= /DNA_END= /DNA_ORIENTATION=
MHFFGTKAYRAAFRDAARLHHPNRIRVFNAMGGGFQND